MIDFLNDVEIDIAQRALAFPATKTIDLVAGAAVYDLKCKIYTIKRFVTPTGWLNSRISLVKDVNRWADIVRAPWGYDEVSEIHPALSYASGSIAGTPLWAHIWGGEIEFYPVPTEAGTLTLECYLYPSDKLDETSETPNLSADWDVCLRFGVMAQIVGGDWERKYKEELATQSHDQIRGHMTGPNTVQSTTDLIGF